MKIALGQMNVVAGRPQRNFDVMKSMILKAKEQGVDLIVFPELCVGGYYL
ncbi:MAG: hypothetical protein HUJ56_09905, partial [Erysipelotrichaceae bacterium]|nr:hypothetical protein [Erysipelotrichaceae bacterium]